jgi:hypothetical protein
MSQSFTKRTFSLRSAKLWDLGQKRRTTTEPTQEKMKYFIDETASANDFYSTVAKQKEVDLEQSPQRQPTPRKKMDSGSPLCSSRQYEQSPKRCQRSPASRTPKRTFTVPSSKTTSVSSCRMWSPDVYNMVLTTVPRKSVLNIPSVKRRALMGYNLPVVNEQNYVSCPAMSKWQVIMVNNG